MGLEVSSYISGLTPSWPVSGDPKNQGDDHLRLLKSVLQSTFPNANAPTYFPSSGGGAAGATLTVANQNAVLFYDTTGGSFNVTLPTLAGTNAGWSCEIMKYSVDANAVTVLPASGNIYSQFGPVATIRIGAVMSLAKFMWSGTTWFCSKHGPLIGSTANFDGPSVPPGYLTLDGTVFNGTTFAELTLALGTNTLRDKRGRVEAGVDNGVTGRLANGFGASGNGAVGGLDYHVLTTAEMPPHRHSAAIYDPSHFHPYSDAAVPGGQKPNGAGTSPWNGTQLSNTSAAVTGVRVNSDGGLDTTYAAGGGALHTIVQPTIVTQKLIRAC